jgi:hypothetical protein
VVEEAADGRLEKLRGEGNHHQGPKAAPRLVLAAEGAPEWVAILALCQRYLGGYVPLGSGKNCLLRHQVSLGSEGLSRHENGMNIAYLKGEEVCYRLPGPAARCFGQYPAEHQCRQLLVASCRLLVRDSSSYASQRANRGIKNVTTHTRPRIRSISDAIQGVAPSKGLRRCCAQSSSRAIQEVGRRAGKVRCRMLALL